MASPIGHAAYIPVYCLVMFEHMQLPWLETAL